MDDSSNQSSNLRDALEAARRELLDLTPRNRLLSTPRRQQRSGVVEISGELSQQVFHRLLTEGKAMSFVPMEEKAESAPAAAPAPPAPAPAAPSMPRVADLPKLSDLEEGVAVLDDHGWSDLDLAQPEEPTIPGAIPGAGAEAVSATGSEANAGDPARMTDDRLQTELASTVLQQRLLRMHYAARSYQEEQGVSVLYLALGFLRWFETQTGEKERFAPLLLLPVELQRPSAAAKFRIRWTGEDPATNLSLKVKLKAEFGLDLPDVPADDEFSPDAYFESVRSAIAGVSRWEVFPNDIVLGFFSFAKLLMYRDLDPGTWPADRPLEGHPLVSAILGAGFQDEPPICGEDEPIDGLLDPIETVHVVDADSSQSLVIEEARRGRSIVIQGPPGTGKSQTIANVIAAAVKDGKRVLFVAEKAAALNVVKDRLSNIGLGDMCLALHSNKAKKALVLEDLGRTLGLERPIVGKLEQTASGLREARDRLNQHARLMNQTVEPCRLSPYRVVGELARLDSRGIKPADFTLDNAHTWSSAQTRHKVGQVRELVRHIEEIGRPADHPWRGVMLDSILPTDLGRLQQRLVDAGAALREAAEAAAALAQRLTLEAPSAFDPGNRIAACGHRLASAPTLDRKSITDDIWQTNRIDIAALIDALLALESSRRRLEGLIAPAGWDINVAEARVSLAAHGRSLLRFLIPAYRRAKATVRGIVVGQAPKSIDAQIELLDGLMACQAARQVVRAADELGRRAFGSVWAGEKTNAEAVAAIERWEAQCAADRDVPADFRRILAGIDDLPALQAESQAVESKLERGHAAVDGVFRAAALDLNVAFPQPRSDEGEAVPAQLGHIDFSAMAERLQAWTTQPEAITKWIAFRHRLEAVLKEGLDEIGIRLNDGRILPGDALDQFDMAYYEALMRHFVKTLPSLAHFDGLSHERVLAQFKKLDEDRIGLARQEVALAHHQGIPRGGAQIGEVGAIRRELGKKRRHLPIRQLLKQAGTAVAAIKPVFMMSPLSIAQYIEPGALEFDILLIDEASQVRPVDALGAIARARQIVVVGDDRQLPPTRFFTREVGDAEIEPAPVSGATPVPGSASALTEPGEASRLGDLESVLGLCVSQNIPQRMLRWHYRSRHHSLIEVSNREFYDGRLYVIPSPEDRSPDRGLVFHHVPNGVFDRGGSATNRIEAEIVAASVMEHARRHPGVTLGVGAFSVQQRDAIIDALEALRRAQPDLEPFFSIEQPEPFFVKNLENIQGDERDVILISVGYGRDKDGFISMNFGPLSADGGERRLNVLITRARSRCEVFSSITYSDIDLSRVSGRGPHAFRTFLAYARSGVLDTGAQSERTPDSVFEDTVAAALTGSGLQVDARVGVAGFFVDLAIRDPLRPGVYILGIECDGAAYSAARSARDRDRLRQMVLEMRGWTLHRIWSHDWFNRPAEQLRRAMDAVEAARQRVASGGDRARATGSGASRPAEPHRPISVQRERSKPAEQAEEQPISVAYQEANFTLPKSQQADELPPSRMMSVVERIVRIEGPIHRQEIAARVRSILGLSRAGPKLVMAVYNAIDEGHRQQKFAAAGDFFSPIDASEIPVRNRADVQSAGLRTLSMLPPAEVRQCVLLLVHSYIRVALDELVVGTARELGFKATSAQLRGLIEAQIGELLAQGHLVERDGRLSLASETALS